MSSETLALVAVALFVVAIPVILLLRAVRQESRLREDLGRLSLSLAAGQRDALGQVTAMVERFHARLGEFGEQVQGGQQRTGDTLRGELEGARRTLQEQLEGLVKAVNAQLGDSQRSIGQQFEGATKVFGEIRGQLGQVAEMAVRMEALGKEIDELQGILKAPKLRGGMGEAQLEECLRQVLAAPYITTQHAFAGGQKVDAAIRLGDRLVPVDAKFPLESFQRMAAADDEGARRTARREFERAVKARIDEIAEKYIRPGEGTYDFALMFIPAENVYYEVIIRDEALGEAGSLLAYATARRVVPVSPNSLYAYLMTIVTGLKGMRVEARAREILTELGKLHREYERFAESFRVLGKHLESAHGKYDEAERIAARLGERLESVTDDTEAAAEDVPHSLTPGSSPG
jgi:DNA recombination protein RmuC